MTKSLQADPISVGELFDESHAHYEIPIYQRNFAWGVEQIEQLIDDVWAAAQTGADNYFLGNLIVARKQAEAEGDAKDVTYEVVDGQQRLTTLLMLLKHLEVEPKAKLTYQSRRTATDALARLATSENEEGSGIHSGFKAIESRLGRFRSSGDDLLGFKRFLRKNVRLVRAVLPDQTDLNKYFEIMNTRGQQLEQVDIVKARLMGYLRSETGVVVAERQCFAWVWDACAEMDSYIQMALTPSDTIKRNKVFGESWNRLENATFDALLQHEPSDGCPNGAGRNTAIGLRDALRHYAQASVSPSQEDEKIEYRRFFESPIKFPTLLLHALKVLRGQGVDDHDDDGQLDDSKLIRLFEEDFDPKRLSESARSVRAKQFAETLIRCKFVLDNYVIKREFTATNGDDGAWSLKRLTRVETERRNSGGTGVNARFVNAFAPGKEEWEDTSVDDATRKVLLLQSMLRVTYTSPRTMHWITRVLREPLLGRTRQEAADGICRTLRRYAQQKVHQGFFAGERPTGFGIERIVFTYLDYLLVVGKSPSLPADPNFTFAYRNSIEHFFPQYPDKEQNGWQRVTSKDQELEMLGNLALISIGANSKFSNNLPEIKVHKFEKTIKQSPKLQLMAKHVQDGRVWDRETIRDHDEATVQLLRGDLRDGGILL